MKHTHLTIGIPAYNEEQNLNHLLQSISEQSLGKHCTIREVIVCSDGSTDGTARIARSFRALKTILIENTKRSGKAQALNSIMKRASGDILVLLDADIAFADTSTLRKLVQPVASGSADLCGAKVLEIQPINMFQKMLAASMNYKRILFESINEGNNIYTCHGRCRALSKRFYRSITFRHSSNEDAYSYLYCIRNGYSYAYRENAVVLYHLPAHLADHESQSVRFFQSRSMSDREFGSGFVMKAYAFPGNLAIGTLLRYIPRDLYIIPYVALSAYLSVKSRLVKRRINTWRVSKSTKISAKEAVV